MSDLPIILGEAPSKSGDRFHMFPLSGAVGEKLCTWAGIAPELNGTRYGRYYWPLNEHFELRNLLERYPGSEGKGAALPMQAAVEAYGALYPSLQDKVVVLLGKRLAKVAGAPDEFFRWTGGGLFANHLDVVIPHPSGLNRAYNADEMRVSAGRALRQAMSYARTWSMGEEVPGNS